MTSTPEQPNGLMVCVSYKIQPPKVVLIVGVVFLPGFMLSAILLTNILQFFLHFALDISEALCNFLIGDALFISLYRTGYVQEQVNIGSSPPGSKVRWFRSSSDEPRFINTVTFDSEENAPTLVMVHGYGASQGFFFRNFDALASRFRVIAIDQLG